MYHREENELQRRLFVQLLELLLQKKLISREEKEQMQLKMSIRAN